VAQRVLAALVRCGENNGHVELSPSLLVNAEWRLLERCPTISTKRLAVRSQHTHSAYSCRRMGANCRQLSRRRWAEPRCLGHPAARSRYSMIAWGTLRRATGHRCKERVSSSFDFDACIESEWGTMRRRQLRAVDGDIHGLLVSDDLDPALDLQIISVRSLSRVVGARTSGMLAVLFVE
jgi:hypothetical protein